MSVAVFNATLSSLLGVFLTPLWLELGLGAAGPSLPFGEVLVDLARWLLLPLLLGQLARPVLGGFAGRHPAVIAALDRLTILLLIYTSFCDSVKSGVWLRTGPTALAFTLVFALAALLIVIATVALVAKRLGFSREDRIAAIFCGSQKTLAAGVPMARLIFGANPGLGLILLPIMVYHPLELVVSGWLAARWAEQRDSLARSPKLS